MDKNNTYDFLKHLSTLSATGLVILSAAAGALESASQMIAIISYMIALTGFTLSFSIFGLMYLVVIEEKGILKNFIVSASAVMFVVTVLIVSYWSFYFFQQVIQKT